MIHDRTPITLVETKEIIDKLEEHDELKKYLKKFTKLKKAEADKLKSELNSLNNIKLKEEYVVKVVDFLPKTSEAVRKIFIDVSLTEEETNAIIDIVKEY